MLTTSKKRNSARAKAKSWVPYAPWGQLPNKPLNTSVDFEFDEFASPLKKIFLPPKALSLKKLSGQKVIVRDGLISILNFFEKNPRPPAEPVPKLFLHETWALFVPKLWRRRCGLYRVVRAPEKSLSESNQSALLSKRKTWVTYFRFDPHFAGTRYLQARLDSYGGQEKMNCIGVFENGDGSCDYQLHSHRSLNAFWARPPENFPAYQLVHSTQMNSCQILDLNERLRCSDDAALHLFLARGGLDPLQRALDQRSEDFIRLSRFHGYALRAINRRSRSHWDGELKNLVHFFKEKFGSRWSEEIALNQFELFDERSFPQARNEFL